MRNGKLYVRDCSDDGGAGHDACSTFSGEEDYFVLEQGALVRYQKFGSGYRRDVALRPDVEGQQIPAEECAGTESGS
ncbi:Secreted protein (fragment) [Xanthomonas citri pv. fuscans]